jgi:hypothetical protein
VCVVDAEALSPLDVQEKDDVIMTSLALRILAAALLPTDQKVP